MSQKKPFVDKGIIFLYVNCFRGFGGGGGGGEIFKWLTCITLPLSHKEYFLTITRNNLLLHTIF